MSGIRLSFDPIMGVYDFKAEEWNWIPNEKEATMKVTKALRDTLVQQATEEYNRAKSFYDTAKQAYAEATNTYHWASGLTVGGELSYGGQRPQINKPVVDVNVPYMSTDFTAYFIPSKSGTTQGHFIRKSNAYPYKVDCTCPGFVNRGYCWASTKINSGVDTSKYYWNKSRSLFNSNRERALNTTTY